MNSVKVKSLFLILFLFASFILCSFIYHLNNSNQFVKTELYFVFSKAGGSNVSIDEWSSFSDSVLSKAIPSGLL